MNVSEVAKVILDAGLTLTNDEAQHNPLQVHFDKGEIAGYVDSDYVDGPWEVILIGHTRYCGGCETPQELKIILESL